MMRAMPATSSAREMILFMEETELRKGCGSGLALPRGMLARMGADPRFMRGTNGAPGEECPGVRNRWKRETLRRRNEDFAADFGVFIFGRHGWNNFSARPRG